MKKTLMAIPSFLTSIVAPLPLLTCPACWPLYAGLLSVLGLGYVDYTPFLLPATAFLSVISVIPLAWKAPQRWGYRPLLIGSFGIALILLGKFWIESPYAYYGGIFILLTASIWNVWPIKTKLCNRC